MSALVVGTASYMGPIGDILLEGGFDEIHLRAGEAAEPLEIDGHRPDILVLVREALKGAELRRIMKKAVALKIPVFLW